MLTLYTIGFTEKTAERFFTLLGEAKVGRVIDVRLFNRSQLAGFSKAGDLEYFLRAILGIEYHHLPILSPTPELFDRFKKQGGSWLQYERDFLQLMRKRKIDQMVDRRLVDGGCLLCSEHEPHHCHRRLVAEYLAKKWGDVEIRHLIE